LVSTDDKPLSPSMRLFILSDEKEVGWITSATRNDRSGKEIALGFVKRGYNEIGTQLRARLVTAPASSVSVQVVELPFL